jgi:hypothetical protein
MITKSAESSSSSSFPPLPPPPPPPASALVPAVAGAQGKAKTARALQGRRRKAKAGSQAKGASQAQALDSSQGKDSAQALLLLCSEGARHINFEVKHEVASIRGKIVLWHPLSSYPSHLYTYTSHLSTHTHSHTHSLTHTHLLTHSLTHSLTHTHEHTHTHTRTHLSVLSSTILGENNWMGIEMEHGALKP